MRRFWLVGGLALALAAACDSGAGLTTPGGPNAVPTSSSGGSSSGSSSGTAGDDDGGGLPKPDPEGWGDPKTVRRPGLLRLEQLNVRRFFDAKCDSGTCSADGFEAQATQEGFDKRVKQIADDLATIQADVITLAEVENQGCLDAVKKSLEAAGFEYPVAYVAETGAPGSIDVALLARGKMDSVKNYQDSHPLPNGAGKFTREFPEIHLTIGKNKVIVFPAHFRSKSNDDPARRLGEAMAAHDIMVATDSANKDAALILLGGDLNDVPGSDPINALESDGKLIRVAKDAAAQGTYKFGGADQPIDHIFVTKAHADAYVAKSATVVRDPSSKGFAGSDHATLYADFTIPE